MWKRGFNDILDTGKLRENVGTSGLNQSTSIFPNQGWYDDVIK